MKMYPLILSMIVFGIHSTDGREINVADHGIVPGKDVTFEVNQLVESIRNESDITLTFPKGQYEFYPENGTEIYRAISNHDNGLKRIVFPFFGHKNITVDGGGSLFLFHGIISPFVLDQTENITLKNFTINWARPVHDEMRVVARNESSKSFTVELDPERYPFTIKDGQFQSQHYKWTDGIGPNIIFDPQTDAPLYNTRDCFIPYWTPINVKPAGKNRIRFDGLRFKTPPPLNSILITYGINPSRLCPAIHITNSKNARVENVTVHDAGGMGVIVERTDNISLNHFVVTSTPDQSVSTRADAAHFVGCKGTIQIEHCRFEHMLDDGINVHGAYVRVEEYLGDNQFICAVSHQQQWGLTFAEAGDRIALLSRETVLPFFESTVTDVQILNEQRLVVTVDQMPDALPDAPLSMENRTWYPNLIVRNNVIRQNRARSVLVTTKGQVLIENNYFSSQMHGILIEGDNKKWYESGAVKDVVIRHNTFENVGFGTPGCYPLYASPMLMPDQRLGGGHYHRNIQFHDNTIKSFNSNVAFARSVQGLTVVGNRLERSLDYPANDANASVELHYCDDVTIQANEAVGFERSLSVKANADCSRLNISAHPFRSKNTQ